MTEWTPEEIERLYNEDQAKMRVVKPHREETLSHRLITLYEMFTYGEGMLEDPETHKGFEQVIREARERRGDRMYGLSEAQVEADPEKAKRKVAMYVLNRMKVMCE